MSNKQITIARILLLISIIIGIGIGIKIGIVSAQELTPAEHVNAKVHVHTAFEHLGQAVLESANLHRDDLKAFVVHHDQAVHINVHHLQDVNAA